MALKVLQLNGNLDGESPIDTAGTDHVAGQPAKLTATGWQLALSFADVVGMFKNDMVDDVKGGPSVGDAPAAGFSNATVLKGQNTVQMSPGFLKTGAVQAPFAFPGAGAGWVKGKHIYCSATGFWDTAPANATEPPFGVVTKVPASATDTLEADMFAMAPFSSAVAT